jgi:hypothetical protein
MLRLTFTSCMSIARAAFLKRAGDGGEKLLARAEAPGLDVIPRRDERLIGASLGPLLRLDRVRRGRAKLDHLGQVRLEPRGLFAIAQCLHRAARVEMLLAARDQLADEPGDDRLPAAVASQPLALEQFGDLVQPAVRKGHLGLSDLEDQHGRSSAKCNRFRKVMIFPVARATSPREHRPHGLLARATGRCCWSYRCAVTV